jgi:hypothetical protein
MQQDLLDKLNVKSAAMLIAAFFIALGAWMVNEGLRDDGYIDFHSALVSGQFRTGFVGAFFAILGALITCLAVLRRHHPHRFKIESSGVLIEWDGMACHTRVLAAQIEAIKQTLAQSEQNSKLFNTESEKTC